MPETEEKVNVRRPRADSMDGGQRDVGLVRRFIGERGKIKFAAIDGFCDGLERANLRR